MERSCARAVELGLPSIAFTEHVDHTRSVIPSAAAVPAGFTAFGPDGRFQAPPLDLTGYLECLERCRSLFSGLRILSGVEIGEPHWFKKQSSTLVATGAYERILGSLHALLVGDDPWFVGTLLGPHAPPGVTAHTVMRAYLLESMRMIEGDSSFAVLAHLDYPLRMWPQSAGAFDPRSFEGEFRAVLRALAASDRVLEINTRLPFHPQIVRWWYEEGGAAVSFGSDAHRPDEIARRFASCAAMAEAAGFVPGDDPAGFWCRRRV
jgi:histidinol-phosphatase (PHP family)